MQWNEIGNIVRTSTPQMEIPMMNTRYDAVNMLGKITSINQTRPIQRWINDFVENCEDSKYKPPSVRVEPRLAEGLETTLKWFETCLDNTNLARLDGTILPRILMDLQVQYMQLIIPILTLSKPSECGLCEVEYNGVKITLDKKGLTFLTLLLLHALRLDTSKVIRSLKKAAKIAIKHCCTAKNRATRGLVGKRQEIYQPRDTNGEYFMPRGLKYGKEHPDDVSDDEDEERIVKRPFHKIGHIIYAEYSKIVQSVVEAHQPPKKILEVTRFLYQSRANTVATEEMRQESLAEWRTLLTTDPGPTDPNVLEQIEAEARKLASEAVKNGFKLPKSIGHLVNTSGKREASVADGGSATAIKRAFGEDLAKISSPTFNLCTGVRSKPTIKSKGDALLHLTVEKLTDELDEEPWEFADEPREIISTPEHESMKFNDISVMEISKARTASIGSIVLQTLLNVVAGIGLPAMKKIKESASAATGGNLAFKFHKQLLQNEDFASDLADGLAHLWEIFSSDLEAATDSGRKDVAMAALRGFFSDPIFDPVRALINIGISAFCANRVLDDGTITVIGWLMGEPITKLLLMIINTICLRLAMRETDDTEAEGAFNGDDVFIATKFQETLTAYLNWVEKVGLKTSWDDTFASNTDHMYIYSEEVGLMPVDRLTAPLIAAEINQKHFTTDILSFKRKLWVPYSKGRGWFQDPRGRFAAMCIDHGYRHCNPTCTVLMQLATTVGSLTGEVRAVPESLPCADTRKGGNAFPLAFPISTNAIKSAIIYQVESGARIAREHIQVFIELSNKETESHWREYKGKLPVTIEELSLTDTARDLADTLTAETDDTLVSIEGTATTKATLAHLLLRTGEYISTDTLFAKLRALSRLESIFLDEEPSRIDDDTVSTTTSSIPDQSHVESLLNVDYIIALRQQERAFAYSKTTGITTLVKRSKIDEEIAEYKFSLPLKREPPASDASSNSEDSTPEEIAERLINHHRNGEWTDILYECRKYRTATDPILLCVAETLPTNIKSEIRIVSRDTDLQRDMARIVDPVEALVDPKSVVRWLERPLKGKLFLAGLELAAVRYGGEIEDSREIMKELIRVPTIDNHNRWLKAIADILQHDIMYLFCKYGLIASDDVPYKQVEGLANAFICDYPVFPDWGHIKAELWLLTLREDTSGLFHLDYISGLHLSEDSKSVHSTEMATTIVSEGP